MRWRQANVWRKLQASLEKKLRAANLQKRNAERSNELSAVMREVRLLPFLLQPLDACTSKPASHVRSVHNMDTPSWLPCHLIFRLLQLWFALFFPIYLRRLLPAG